MNFRSSALWTHVWPNACVSNAVVAGTTWKQHFDENLDFKWLDYDAVTRKRRFNVDKQEGSIYDKSE